MVVFATISQILLPLLAWAIIPMQWNWKIFDVKVMPWRIFLFLSSLLNGINFFCLYRLPESPKYLLSTNRKEETLNILRKMYAINTGFNEQVFIDQSIQTFKTKLFIFCLLLYPKKNDVILLLKRNAPSACDHC